MFIHIEDIESFRSEAIKAIKGEVCTTCPECTISHKQRCEVMYRQEADKIINILEKYEFCKGIEYYETKT